MAVKTMIFVDTGAWIAILNPNDQHYREAETIYEGLQQQRIRFLTTDYVFARLSVTDPSQIHPRIKNMHRELNLCYTLRINNKSRALYFPYIHLH